MGSAQARVELQEVDFGLIATRPNPVLYLIQFRRNIASFENVLPIKMGRVWELHASYETESDMLHAFDELCKRENVKSGLYTFRCVWPDGRIKTSEHKVIKSALH